MANWLDTILLVLLFAIGLICTIGGLMLLHQEDQQRNRSSQCPPHKWVQDDQMRLVCTKCGLRPDELQDRPTHYLEG